MLRIKLSGGREFSSPKSPTSCSCQTLPAILKKMSTEKKNQHYIPKFYLRNFSFQKNEKQIGIFNLKSSFFFDKATLKDQGSKNFFYGQDGIIEDRLSNVEGQLATLVNTIIKHKIIPKKDTYLHITLLTFIGLTDIRNPVFISFIKDSLETAMTKELLELDANADIEKLVRKISHSDAIQMALSGLKPILENTTDLDFKLLINKTAKPFICSDFPVIKYNKFLESKKWKHGKTGYANTGLQIFIPLNPEISIVLYDQTVYNVGFKKDMYLEITNENEINQLNILQILNCTNTVFFNENCSEFYIRELIKKASKYKKANEVLSSSSYLLNENENPKELDIKVKKKNLIIVGSTDCEINLNINGIKIHSGLAKIKMDYSMVSMRKHPKSLRKNSR